MKFPSFFGTLILAGPYLFPTSLTATPNPYWQITVTSTQDNIQADGELTLREALGLLGGQIPLDRFSPAERQQLQPRTGGHQITFNLPTPQAQILLESALPPIATAQVSIIGPGSTHQSLLQGRSFATPQVEIRPAPGKMIPYGLSLQADNITIRGLSLYGFQMGPGDSTPNLPAADIIIGMSDRPTPQNITITENFLGIRADRSMPDQTSDFGIYIWRGRNTTISHNAIAHHSASGIITQVESPNLSIVHNGIFANGTSGMPDAIRLEGRLENNQIRGNTICGNDGSGVFLFKPELGAVAITDNRLEANGRRLRRAAIHLMGNNHRVLNNDIAFQAGAGVSIAGLAQPQMGDTPAMNNRVMGNRFYQLEGLSVDLVTQRNDAVEDLQDGDGANPSSNSGHRRLDTANGGIDAPRFLATEFYRWGDRVHLDGSAEAGAQVEIYRVDSAEATEPQGPLSSPLQTVTADARGRFRATLVGLELGTQLSAIATTDRGTSEPARNVLITLPGQQPPLVRRRVLPNNCQLVAPATPAVPTPGPEPVATNPQPPQSPEPVVVKISIPRRVHFALDKSHLSPTSRQLLDRVAQVLQAHPDITVDLAGHTDPRAPQAYNQALGLRRATAVRNYLLRRGVAPQRMTVRSLSFRQRASVEQGIRPYALDRRVELEYRDLQGRSLEIIDTFDDLQLEGPDQ